MGGKKDHLKREGGQRGRVTYEQVHKLEYTQEIDYNPDSKLFMLTGLACTALV